METSEFLKNLGLMILGILLIGGFGYWCKYALNKMKPDLKYTLRYDLFGKKFNDKEVEMLVDYAQAVLEVDAVNKILLTIKGYQSKKAKELCWIYRQITKKGVQKNE